MTQERRTLLHGLMLTVVSIIVAISTLIGPLRNATEEKIHVVGLVSGAVSEPQVLRPEIRKLTEIRPTDTPLPPWVPTYTPTATRTPRPATPTATVDPEKKVSSKGLIWPIEGAIAAYYGSSHPLGIDIDLEDRKLSREELSVKAATDGEVVFAGGNPCCSYGNYLVIMSPEGIETLYAHLAEIKVFQGERVKQGDVIAQTGSTGYSTGIHLHFEVIDKGVRQNPLDYLP